MQENPHSRAHRHFRNFLLQSTGNIAGSHLFLHLLFISRPLVSFLRGQSDNKTFLFLLTKKLNKTLNLRKKVFLLIGLVGKSQKMVLLSTLFKVLKIKTYKYLYVLIQIKEQRCL